MKLSVVIPSLNEAANISALLEYLLDTPGVADVVVADGGSTDGTTDSVRPPVRLVRSGAGRGIQLDAGARAASGNVLPFLHADVVPPPDVVFQIENAVERGCIGGNFRSRYPEGGLLGRRLKLIAPCYRALNCYYGDLGIFVRRGVYERVCGFPEIPTMTISSSSARWRERARLPSCQAR